MQLLLETARANDADRLSHFYCSTYSASVNLSLLVHAAQPDHKHEPQRPTLHLGCICFHDNSVSDVWAQKWPYRRLSSDTLLSTNKGEECEAVNRLLRHAEHLY